MEIYKGRHVLDLSHVCTNIPLVIGKLLELWSHSWLLLIMPSLSGINMVTLLVSYFYT